MSDQLQTNQVIRTLKAFEVTFKVGRGKLTWTRYAEDLSDATTSALTQLEREYFGAAKLLSVKEVRE